MPLVKKPSIDPAVAQNYRPVIIFTIFSKLLEMFARQESGCHDLDDSQFGFIQGRSTNMAISLAQDVITYNVYNKTAMYTCSLDAEGAFAALPFPVLFRKAYGILPSVCWRIMYLWHSNISAQIRWNGSLGKYIKIMKGTCQRDLSSSFLFNVFYQCVVNKLCEACRRFLYQRGEIKCVLLCR